MQCIFLEMQCHVWVLGFVDVIGIKGVLEDGGDLVFRWTGMHCKVTWMNVFNVVSAEGIDGIGGVLYWSLHKG